MHQVMLLPMFQLPYHHLYHSCFHIPHALCLHCKVCIQYSLLGFYLDHISGVSRNCNIYYQTCSFFIITDCDVWFTVTDCSAGLHL